MTPIYSASASSKSEYELATIAEKGSFGNVGFVLRSPVYFEASYDDDFDDFEDDDDATDDDDDFDDEDLDDDFDDEDSDDFPDEDEDDFGDEDEDDFGYDDDIEYDDLDE